MIKLHKLQSTHHNCVNLKVRIHCYRNPTTIMTADFLLNWLMVTACDQSHSNEQ